MRASGIDMYGSRADFLGLMSAVKESFGVLFFASRSLSPISPVDEFPRCEPFGYIGCITWPEFIGNVNTKQRAVNDGNNYYFVEDDSFCFSASWIIFDFEKESNCSIAYRRHYLRDGEIREKPKELTAKYGEVSRFVKKETEKASRRGIFVLRGRVTNDPARV
jgi:hypothetical protein